MSEQGEIMREYEDALKNAYYVRCGSRFCGFCCLHSKAKVPASVHSLQLASAWRRGVFGIWERQSLPPSPLSLFRRKCKSVTGIKRRGFTPSSQSLLSGNRDFSLCIH